MYVAYADESLDATGWLVYAVSGVFGSEPDWAAITESWLRRLNGRVFHAADCESGAGQFFNLSGSERVKLYRDLVQLFINSKLIAAAEATALAEYREVFPRDFDRAPYLWMFGDIVQEMAGLAYASIPRGTVQVTFDRTDLQNNAELLYDIVRRSRNQQVVQTLSEKAFFSSRSDVGVQIADLIARETMKRMKDDLLSVCRIRGSFAALRDSGRFRFHFLRKKDFDDAKGLLANSAKRDNFALSRYYDWIAANHLQDCQSNRLRYINVNSQAAGILPP